MRSLYLVGKYIVPWAPKYSTLLYSTRLYYTILGQLWSLGSASLLRGGRCHRGLEVTCSLRFRLAARRPTSVPVLGLLMCGSYRVWYIYIYVYVHISMYTYKYVYIYVQTYIHICIHVCTHIYRYMYTQIDTHMNHLHIHIHLYMCMSSFCVLSHVLLHLCGYSLLFLILCFRILHTYAYVLFTICCH